MPTINRREVHVPRSKLWLAVICATAWISGWSETVVYQHGTVIEAMQGKVVIDRRYEVRVEVPVADCPDEPVSCVEDQPFSVAYRFQLQRIKLSTRQGAYARSVEPVGTIWVAANLTEAEEAAFETKLRKAVNQLRGEAFSITYCLECFDKRNLAVFAGDK